MLVFTGFPHTASEIAATYNFTPDLHILMEHVKQGGEILTSNTDIREFGKLLGEAWQVKKKLSDAISTPYIDFLYGKTLTAGAIGGKVLGAGGGGFMLLFCEPEKQQAVKDSLRGLLFVPFRFENRGTTVILDNGKEN